VARTKGATGKKKNGISLMVGIGVPPIDKKDLESSVKPPKSRTKSTTQGAKPYNRVPNTMRKTRIPKP